MPTKTERTVAAILVSRSLYFVAKHAADSPTGRQWMFPGGPLLAGTTPQQALQRHLKDKLNLDATVGERVGVFAAGTAAEPVTVECFRISSFTGELALSSYTACAWLGDRSLQGMGFAKPHDEIVRFLAEQPVQRSV